MKTRLMCLKKKNQRMTTTYVGCAKERRGQVQEVLQEGRRRRRTRKRSYGVMMMMSVLMTPASDQHRGTGTTPWRLGKFGLSLESTVRNREIGTDKKEPSWNLPQFLPKKKELTYLGSADQESVFSRCSTL